MKLSNEFAPIRNWATLRGLYDKGNPGSQTLKLQEEVGELSKAILEKDMPGAIDAIGDCVVVLTNLAHLLGTSIEHCTNSAYEEIKNRKGGMQNGTFIREK